MTPPCTDCPFASACPMKNRVTRKCFIGRHPMRTYMSLWAGALALSFFI